MDRRSFLKFLATLPAAAAVASFPGALAAPLTGSITNLPPPINPSDCVTKDYVDSIAGRGEYVLEIGDIKLFCTPDIDVPALEPIRLGFHGYTTRHVQLSSRKFTVRSYEVPHDVVQKVRDKINRFIGIVNEPIENRMWPELDNAVLSLVGPKTTLATLTGCFIEELSIAPTQNPEYADITCQLQYSYLQYLNPEIFSEKT